MKADYPTLLFESRSFMQPSLLNLHKELMNFLKKSLFLLKLQVEAPEQPAFTPLTFLEIVHSQSLFQTFSLLFASKQEVALVLALSTAPVQLYFP